MGWRDAPIVKAGPEALQKPIDPTQTPGFQASVAGATARARAGVESETPPPGYRWADATRTRLIPIPGGPADKAPAQLNAQQKAAAREDAAYRVGLARQLRENTKGLTGTGLFGPLFSNFGGTRSADAEAIIENLRQKGAMASILEMLQETGGKNPFTPMSQGEVAIIAGAKIPPMGINLSDKTNEQSSRQIERAGARAYNLLGGNQAQLEADIARLFGRSQQSKAAKDGISVKRIR